MSGLELRGVVKRFGDVVVVKQLNLSIAEGEFLVLLGESGCGKSTTLRMIAGLEEVTEGRVFIGGRDVTDTHPMDRDIAMVFQNYALYPQIRTLILTQQGLRELQRLIHPTVVNPVRIGGNPIPQNIAGAVLGFIFLYALTVGELTFLLVASGLDFISAFTAIIACINNAGPGLNVVGPAQNYQALTDFQTWICSLAMLAGRLEIFSLFVLFTPYFWRR